jgi:dCTP deaminase
MILTGSKIIEEIRKKDIVIRPFSLNQVNPNSYNYRLGSVLKIFWKFDGIKAIFKEIKIPPKGYVLRPGRMYLGITKEIIGSQEYAMSLIGRSSMGRYGLFLQASANLGHTTSKHRWTLEIVAAQPIRIYAGMIIGQVSFWTNYGTVKKYKGRYGFLNYPQESFAPIFCGKKL